MGVRVVGGSTRLSGNAKSPAHLHRSHPLPSMLRLIGRFWGPKPSSTFFLHSLFLSTGRTRQLPGWLPTALPRGEVGVGHGHVSSSCVGVGGQGPPPTQELASGGATASSADAPCCTGRAKMDAPTSCEPASWALRGTGGADGGLERGQPPSQPAGRLAVYPGFWGFRTRPTSHIQPYPASRG